MLIGFVHIPKTGGSTMKFVLRSSFGVRHCDVRSLRPDRRFAADELILARRTHPFGLRSIAGHDLRFAGRNLSADVHLFTFLRDPVERTASHYQHHARGGRRIRLGHPLLSLEEWLDRRPEGNNFQVCQLAGGVDVERAKRELEDYFFVGLVEDFDTSIEMLTALSPYPLDPQYLVRNAAPDDRLKHDILSDPVRRKLLEQNNQADQELYEWARDVVYPAQRERAASGTGHPVFRSLPMRLARARASRMYTQVLHEALVLKVRERLRG